METIKLRSHIGTDGILSLQLPAEFKDTSVDVVVVIQPLLSEKTNSRINAWGKVTTEQSIQAAIMRMKELRTEVALDKESVHEMMIEGRRF